MNAINVDIVRSLFMPLFLGGTLAAAALAVMAILRWDEPGAMVMLAGGVLYVVGMFVVTMVFNARSEVRHPCLAEISYVLDALPKHFKCPTAPQPFQFGK